jgi:hypothetical protein
MDRALFAVVKRGFECVRSFGLCDLPFAQAQFCGLSRLPVQ